MVAWMIDRTARRRSAAVAAAACDAARSRGLCLTEPGAGSDAAAITTSAIADGDEYVLTGVKQFISGAGEASVYVVMARTGEPGAKGVTAFLVPADVAGLSFGPNEHKMGWNAQPTRQVVLDEVRVPASAVLGEVGGGFRIAMKGSTAARQHRRLLARRCAVGARPRRALRARAVHVREALAERQSVVFALADMATELVAARASSCAPLGRSTRTRPTSPSVRDGEALRDGCRVRDRQPGAQLHGGYGYLQEYGIEKVVRDLRVHQILEGTNEIMRVVIGRGVVGHDRPGPSWKTGDMSDYETILVETRGRVGWITLNRPEALNALNSQVMRDVVAAAGRSTPTRRSARSS
jgi:alkylation response protein AidB-like acyl-CoA dehydrogenase